MCVTCGCESQRQSNEIVDQTKPYIIEHHYYHHGDVQHHYHYHSSEHGAISPPSPPIYHKIAPPDQPSASHNERLVTIEQHVLAKNDQIAMHNAAHFKERNILALNLMSSPGSGKTTLLTETLNHIKTKMACAVIEGDQHTNNDAQKIEATAVPVIQINTGKGCHLDAQMVHQALHHLTLSNDSLLFIENVGNLVCPASFNLGEKRKIVIISVTEGDDKPLKYPHMFVAADLLIINKIDLLPYVDFNVNACIANAQQINPHLTALCLSCTTGEGLDTWLFWLEQQRCV